MTENTHIFLEPMTLEDCKNKEYLSWLNNPQINKFLTTKSGTIDSAKRYVQDRILNPYSGMFKIMYSDGLDRNRNYIYEWVGTVTYYDMKIGELNEVTLGILVGKSYQGKGIGATALKQLMDFVNKEYGVTRFNIGCYCENLAAYKCYTKIGFKPYQYSFILDYKGDKDEVV